MNKELYQYAIQVIDVLLEKKIYTNDEGVSQFGEAKWGLLRQWFKSHGKPGTFLTNYAINLQSRTDLKTLRLQCEQQIKQIDQEEHDRNLRNRESIENIKGIKNAKITSWIAIVISILALIVAILSATIWK